MWSKSCFEWANRKSCFTKANWKPNNNNNLKNNMKKIYVFLLSLHEAKTWRVQFYFTNNCASLSLKQWHYFCLQLPEQTTTIKTYKLNCGEVICDFSAISVSLICRLLLLTDQFLPRQFASFIAFLWIPGESSDGKLCWLLGCVVLLTCATV